MILNDDLKDLVINKTTALSVSNNNGEVKIRGYSRINHFVISVPFDQLEKWVASIREQIIPNATGAVECNECLYHETRGDPYCAECGKRMRR